MSGDKPIEDSTNVGNVERAYLAGWITDDEMTAYFDDGYYAEELDDAFTNELIKTVLAAAKEQE